jgi:hypothetical protein
LNAVARREMRVISDTAVSRHGVDARTSPGMTRTASIKRPILAPMRFHGDDNKRSALIGNRTN